ncbi:aldo/keto reductase [Nitzschia inconspicua]|uniref:Aldo/keto reductase n=1 Tax=Nitzschia inconspicua TaxID=303405 RepID=A0A9K3L6Y7_9STRA|nr:aldo/keto reductase [Nitzschia inconspicua]
MRTTVGALPCFGLGMAALGRPGYINLNRDAVFGSDARTLDKMQTQADQVLDMLFRLSKKSGFIPWIDCARSYGLSEKFAGEYLKKRNIKRDEVFVSSKWGYTYVADWNVQLDPGEPHEVKDHSAYNFLKQLDETVSFLGDYVNLYQIHSATLESGVLENADVHKALSQCRKERGWAIGLSVSSPKQDEVIRRAMEIHVDGTKLFDSVQCTYNVLEQRPGPVLIEAHQSGMDIIIKEGLANGRVLQNPIIQEYSRKLSCEPDQLALACILAQPFRPRVLSGAVTPDQLQSNWAAKELARKVQEDPTMLAEIMDQTKIESEKYWSERSTLAWN